MTATATTHEGFGPAPIIGEHNLDLEVLELDNLRYGDRVDQRVEASITAASYELVIDGASTLTVTISDPGRDLLKAATLTSAVDVKVDGVTFRLVKIGKQGDLITLTFEDRAVAMLRGQKGSRVAYRNKMTRAQFARSLVREVKRHPIAFHSPDVNVRQPVAKGDAVPGGGTSKGLTRSSNIKIKGAPADTSQLKNLNVALDRCASIKATPRAVLALLASMIVESECRNVQGKGSDAVSFGVVQAIPGTSGKVGGGSFTKAQALDVAFSVGSVLRYSCTGFENSSPGGGGLIGVSKRHPDWTLGRVAAVVINGAVNQGQGAPAYVAAVNKHADEARAILKAYTGGSMDVRGTQDASSSAPASRREAGRYAFRRGEPGKPEDSWTCLQRLASEVGWRCFASRGEVWFVSDKTLRREAPQYELTEDDAAVLALDFDKDTGKATESVDAKVLAGRWRIAPGRVVSVLDLGVADGLYLVSRVTRDLFKPTCDVTLTRPTSPLPEPAADTPAGNGAGDSPTGSGGASGTSSASSLSRVNVGTEWSGTLSIFQQFITPLMRRQGLVPGSQKRTPADNARIGGSATSDHLTTKGTSYAIDYPTTNGLAAARALAKAIGWNAWQPNSWAHYSFIVDGKRFDMQIGWGAAIEHGDHVHVGITRV